MSHQRYFLPSPTMRMPMTVLAGIFRRRGVGETVEAGKLHLPRIIPGNPQIVEVCTPNRCHLGLVIDLLISKP